jgi:hypothetical protein
MRDLNNKEVNLVGGGDFGDSGPTPISRGESIQDLIDAWNAAHPAHPIV